MSDVAIVAYGAISAFGEGADAASAGIVGRPARLAVARDPELERAGLARPFAARVLAPRDDDRAAWLLLRAIEACAANLDGVRPGWRDQRVGLVLGTSSGGMRHAERAFELLARGERVVDGEAATYFGPAARAVRRARLAFDPCVIVLGACASATLAVGVGVRWLERGSCDVVLVGGFDEVTPFVAAGFEVLRATTASPPPRPFRTGRDGMALGEGAAVLGLVATAVEALAVVRGFGAACDAAHLTAPDREGRGLARAASKALEEAGRGTVDLVSAHATATPLNDTAELRGLASVLGQAAARDVAVHPFKAQIGHALGAAGALELLAAIDAMRRRLLPAAAGEGELDPEAPARVLDRAIVGEPTRVLKVSSAFGGANAAVVVDRGDGRAFDGRAASLRPVFVDVAVVVDEPPEVDDLARKLSMPPDRVARSDAFVRLALAAVGRLRDAYGSLAGSAIVAGSALATIETNAVFAARLRDRGALAAEPRRFPYTSPNAMCGECAIAFGLTGPAFAVGGGWHAGLEALACAALLVEAGDAERAVVVAVDDAGPVTSAIAPGLLHTGGVAVVLSSEAGPSTRARIGAMTLRRAPIGGADVLMPHVRRSALGHAALLPLVGNPLPLDLTCDPGDGTWARVELRAV